MVGYPYLLERFPIIWHSKFLASLVVGREWAYCEQLMISPHSIMKICSTEQSDWSTPNSGVLNPFDVDVTNVSDSALTTHSANNNLASWLIVDISHSKARLAEEY